MFPNDRDTKNMVRPTANMVAINSEREDNDRDAKEIVKDRVLVNVQSTLEPFLLTFRVCIFNARFYELLLCGCQYILSFSLCDCIQKNSFETHHFLSLARYAYYRWVERWMDRMVIMSSQGGILSPISL